MLNIILINFIIFSGFDLTLNGGFDWGRVKAKRDKYVERLNGIYGNNLDKSNVDLIRGTAKFIGAKEDSLNT